MLDYKQKYLKYKEKYLTLKKQLGGAFDNFSIETLDSGINLYHGSFNKVYGNLNAPAYYSRDPLQSLGHLLSTSTKIDNAISEIPDKDIDKISTCYPLIYVYTLNTKIKLLKMKVGLNLFNESFGILLNKSVIKKYLDLLENKNVVLNNFKTKLSLIGSNITSNYETTYSDFDSKFNYLFDLYLSKCSNECFAGWANTPGYYILSSINYNSYLKEIMEDVIGSNQLDGIYVENDQDEIILFNNDKFESVNKIQYVLPYSYKEKTDEEIKSFIKKYDDACILYMSKDSIENRQIGKRNLIELFKLFNQINDEQKWNFDWFQVYCKNYNPYENTNEDTCELKGKVVDEVDEVDKVGKVKCYKLKCSKRFPINFDALRVDFDMDQFECNDIYSFLNSKLSILNIDGHSRLLRDWIDMVLSDKFSESNLNISSQICLNRTAQYNRIL